MSFSETCNSGEIVLSFSFQDVRSRNAGIIWSQDSR